MKDKGLLMVTGCEVDQERWTSVLRGIFYGRNVLDRKRTPAARLWSDESICRIYVGTFQFNFRLHGRNSQVRLFTKLPQGLHVEGLTDVYYQCKKYRMMNYFFRILRVSSFNELSYYLYLWYTVTSLPWILLLIINRRMDEVTNIRHDNFLLS